MNQPPAFDYETLDEEIRSFVQRKTDETRGLLRRTAQNVIAIGRNIQAVKEQLPHGQFLPWLQTEFAMTERHARNFMHAAARFGNKPEIIADLSATVIYELAAPSTPEVVIEQVESKHIPPMLEAIRAAKEAERQAREAEERAKRALLSLQKEAQAQQETITQLTRDIEVLQERIAVLSTRTVQIDEGEQPGIQLEIMAELESLRQQVQQLTQQRDVLTQQVAQLGEEARAAALKRDEEEQDRRIRLHWFRLTNTFQASLRSLLAEWPSPLDTQVFEASDWARLAQIKALARRFLAECDALTGGSGSMVVDGSAIPPEETSKKRKEP
jgi:hypothetical protein